MTVLLFSSKFKSSFIYECVLIQRLGISRQLIAIVFQVSIILEPLNVSISEKGEEDINKGLIHGVEMG